MTDGKGCHVVENIYPAFPGKIYTFFIIKFLSMIFIYGTCSTTRVEVQNSSHSRSVFNFINESGSWTALRSNPIWKQKPAMDSPSITGRGEFRIDYLLHAMLFGNYNFNNIIFLKSRFVVDQKFLNNVMSLDSII